MTARADHGAASAQLAAAAAAYAVGCWCAATFPLPVPVSALVLGVAGVIWFAGEAAIVRLIVVWSLAGLALGGATHTLTEGASVGGTEDVVIEAVVATDQGDADQVVRAAGRRFRLRDAPRRVPLGAPVLVSGSLGPTRGAPRWRRLDHYRRVAGELRVTDLEVTGAPNAFVAAANAVRVDLQSAAHEALPTNRAALLLGLLIGDDSGFSDQEVAAFRRAGLTHLVAVSGSNLVLVLGTLTFVLTRLPLGFRVRIASVVIAMAFYVIVTRGEPSVIRAATMAGLAFAAAWIGVVRDGRRGFLLAVLALGVTDPFLFSSVGFQLSVAATAGIIWGYAPVRSRLDSYLPAPIATTIALTAAAQIAVAPVLVWQFGTLSIASLAANVLAVPLAGMLTIAGAVAAPVAFFAPDAFKILSAPLGWLLLIGDWFGNVPLAEIDIDRTTLIVVGSVLVVVSLSVRTWRTRVVAAVIVIGLSAVYAPAAQLGARLPACPGVVFLDVGQGDAHVLRGPDNSRVLVDTGPDPEILLKRLSEAGVGSLDAVLLTHGHADHIGGLEELVRERRVRTVVVSPAMTWPSARARAARDSVSRYGVPLVELGAGDRRSIGEIDLEVLWPERTSEPNEHADPNESSLVVNAHVGSLDVLLLGDIGSAPQRAVVTRLGAGADLVDVVKVAHQGAKDQFGELAIETSPAIAVIPVGENTYGHPAPGTVDLYEDAGAAVVRTDERGSVSVCPTESGVGLHTAERAAR